MKKIIFSLILSAFTMIAFAQREDEDNDEHKGFRKENLFSGGSISLSFFNNSFLVGGNPVLGYKLARWADAGIVGNYTYVSYHDYFILNDKVRQSVYGGGGFVRLFPVQFLFAQAQLEHNWIRVKAIFPPNSAGYTTDASTKTATSLLVGAGYTTNRNGDENSTFGYFSILWDVMGNQYSPYTDGANNSVPVIRAGINIPLFGGTGRR